MSQKLSYADLAAAADAFCKDIPDHAGQSAYPPRGFWVESTPQGHGDQIGVICADGRKVRGPLEKYLPAVRATHRVAQPGQPTPKTAMPAGKEVSKKNKP